MSRVSVLMPVFNAEPFLGAAVESILNQTFGDFEYVIIDDGSTDASLEILRAYAARDDRIRLSSRENRGLIATLNEGLELAQEPLLARMDADDISMPVRLEKQVAHMDAHPECVAVGSAFRWLLPDGEEAQVVQCSLTHESIDDEYMRRKPGFGLLHPTALFRTQALRQIGGYRPDFKYAEDNDLFLRLAEVGRLANLPDALLLYRQHPANTKYKHTLEQGRSGMRALEQAYRRRGLDPAGLEKFRGRLPAHPAMGRAERDLVWMALKGKNVQAARKYAWRALKRTPWSIETLRALYCALRGY